MFVFFHDSKSILVINPSGQIRKLFTPFRVYRIARDATSAKIAKGWVYVDEVQIDKTDKILYLIGGKLYPYHFFEIKINF